VGNGVVPAQVQLRSGCTFDNTYSGTAKCNALEGFGRALHGAQDFYSHSNWADESDPTKPISVLNPPGLNLLAPAPVLDLAGTGPVPLGDVPTTFTTGYYQLGLDYCTFLNTRIRHACLNKDSAGVIDSAGNAPSAGTPRGQVRHNEQKAVTAAIAETRHQWAVFQQTLRSRYGADKGNRMILALTQDVSQIDVVFAIDTTGSMSPYIAGAVDAANSIVDELAGVGSSARSMDYRVGLVDYKDVDSSGCGGSYDAHTDLEFTTDRAAIVAALNTLPGMVSGGCDIPEDVLSGVDGAVGFPWRPGVHKVVIVMGDAEGHDPEPHSSLTTASVIAHAKAVDPAVVMPILVGGSGTATTFFTALATGTGGAPTPRTAPSL
jgi:hypothetical protein